ncbi:hypothetical protein M0813_28463 [Anaeramoeba flamelloides]|uniref:Glucosidase II subunit alpha n=1 Tax=Anaeramoeba flamelloides TaxID=1746091 RepID=A0ABQ8XSN5_9EUKA|nr:hypothetical protein M0813_28463 [Anaeramoeba flamelloides]
MKTNQFIVLFFLVCLTCCNEEQNFKKCRDSNYCKSRKLFQDKTKESSYQIIPNSIKTEKQLFECKLERKNSKNKHGSLILQITFPLANVVRVIINEEDPKNNRYQMESLLAKETFEQQKYILEESEDYCFFKMDDESNQKESSFLIKLEKKEHFGISVLSLDGEEILKINDKSLLSFETSKTSKQSKPKQGSSQSDSEPYGGSSVSLDITFQNSGNLYGLPEHTTGLSLEDTKEGEPYRLFNVDVLDYEIGSREALYGAVPMILSKTKKKEMLNAVFWNNPAETWVDISTDRMKTKNKQFKKNRAVHFMSETGVIDLFIIVGKEKQMYQTFTNYAKLTGFPFLPPIFSLGYHQSRYTYKSEKEILRLQSTFDQLDIPFDVLWLDIEHTEGIKYFTFDPINFPNPSGLIDTISKPGRKMVSVVDPHIKKDPNWELFKDALESDFFIQQNTKTNKFFEGECWPGLSLWPDFLNPKVREWWSSRFSYDKYEGSTKNLYIWNDMNEPSVFHLPENTLPRDTIHFGEIENRNIHNLYGLLVTQSTFNGLINRNQDQNERPFILSRSFFAGSQKYSAIWTGDNTANWEHLKYTDSMLVSLNLAGLPFVGDDVGGFLKNPEAELLTRWFQTGSFHPFFRSHSHTDTKKMEPWVFGEPYTGIIRKWIKNRYSLLPFYYTQFHKASTLGKPIMRPLWLVFPNEINPTQKKYELQSYMIGSSILVFPISEKEQKTKKIYLPKGIWYDFETFKKMKSKGKLFTVKTPIEKIPVFYRGGKIVPRKTRIRKCTHLMSNDPITLFVFLDENQKSSGSIYIDDGHSYDYKNLNKFISQKFVFDDHSLSTVTNNNNYDSTLIERIVILGLSKNNIQDIKLNNSKSLEFELQNKILTIRKPNIYIGNDWVIDLITKDNEL